MNLNLDKEFLGKRIIVTGASKGLGAEACKALEERGAKIAMLSRSKRKMDKLISKFKNPFNHISIRVDLINDREIKSAIKNLEEFRKKEFGNIRFGT